MFFDFMTLRLLELYVVQFVKMRDQAPAWISAGVSFIPFRLARSQFPVPAFPLCTIPHADSPVSPLSLFFPLSPFHPVHLARLALLLAPKLSDHCQPQSSFQNQLCFQFLSGVFVLLLSSAVFLSACLYPKQDIICALLSHQERQAHSKTGQMLLWCRLLSVFQPQSFLADMVLDFNIGIFYCLHPHSSRFVLCVTLVPSAFEDNLYNVALML